MLIAANYMSMTEMSMTYAVGFGFKFYLESRQSRPGQTSWVVGSSVPQRRSLTPVVNYCLSDVGRRNQKVRVVALNVTSTTFMLGSPFGRQLCLK